MENTPADLLASGTYTKQNFVCDNTLDDAKLATRCPLDNGRHADTSIPVRHLAGQLDKLPVEILTQVLLYTDIPSLTRFRRVNRRAMDLVDSIPQYAAIIKHCPDIIRAILSIQADAFNCSTLYATLCTTQCAKCKCFGNHLFLIDCRRVCYMCFTRKLEFSPLTIDSAKRFFPLQGTQLPNALTMSQRLRAANVPSILSLPGRYCTSWASEGGSLVEKRLQLFHRRAVVDGLAAFGRQRLDKTNKEPNRFMAIVTAPHLFDSGRQADWGYFCLACRYEEADATRHFRIKYTREEALKHMAKYGPAKELPSLPGRFMHVKD
ncbi:hypothetical protein EDB80DRAFT_701256 [Ilyonectria destructans]|nr:hypothetical protein EDB80DRAFT_701256 [Ilyonectria destructans]